jgi:hypothetical protein
VSDLCSNLSTLARRKSAEGKHRPDDTQARCTKYTPESSHALNSSTGWVDHSAPEAEREEDDRGAGGTVWRV